MMPTSRRSPIVGSKCLAGQPAVRTGGNDEWLETEQVQRIVDRRVRGVGDRDERPTRCTLSPDGQRRQVADRTAAHEAAGCFHRHSCGAAEQFDHLVLGSHRAGTFQPRLR